MKKVVKAVKKPAKKTKVRKSASGEVQSSRLYVAKGGMVRPNKAMKKKMGFSC